MHIECPECHKFAPAKKLHASSVGGKDASGKVVPERPAITFTFSCACGAKGGGQKT